MLRELKKPELKQFILDVQESFQKGFEDYFGHSDVIIIPEKDILSSYNAKGAKTFVLEEDNKILGGVIVQINDNNVNELHILYVKVGIQNKGVGYKIWSAIEAMFPNTIKWTTCTPYFDQRNINFYVNKCGFHIVEFINKYHNPEPFEEDFIGDNGEGMFEFEKIMSKA